MASRNSQCDKALRKAMLAAVGGMNQAAAVPQGAVAKAGALKATIVAFALALGAVGPTIAEPLEDGSVAYSRGDYVAAFKIFSLLASQGDAEAQSTVGLMYLRGEGVPKDLEQALKWYRLAANQGNAFAQATLGDMYYQGQGVPKDYVLAYMWNNLASAHDYETASKNRDFLAKLMTPAQIAEAQKLAREWKPKK